MFHLVQKYGLSDQTQTLNRRRNPLKKRTGKSDWHVTLFERQDIAVLRPTESTEIEVSLDDIYDGVIH